MLLNMIKSATKTFRFLDQSPVLSHITQTFQGLSTIRGFKAENWMRNKFYLYQNNHASASFLTIAASRAFAFWIEFFWLLYTIIITLSFLLFENHFSSGNVGLVILQCATVVGMVQWSILQTAELENQMIRIERILEYANLSKEGHLESIKETRPKEDWPTEGRLEFKDFKLRYSCRGEYVLKGLNFTIESKEKIGIVGRTGAGKSSIIQALFRLAYNEGVIEIDGVDISKLGLYDLRKRISIIPQDPVLFSGTVRYNLDPSGSSCDYDLWKALEDVELKEYVKSLSDGLDSKISEAGSNFSMGQRQLVCLARAILKSNRILILDEATANVDQETDKLIQKTIRTKFVDCTVLTIAHRLDSIMDSDRVLVMDKGCLIEFDSVENLLKKSNGYFNNLLSESKIVKNKI